MSHFTQKLGLPVMSASQAQKHVTHNEALVILDSLVQLGLVSRSLEAPPADPQDGSCYLVAGEGAGLWEGRGSTIAHWQSPEWTYFQPRAGWISWVVDEELLLVFDGDVWRPFPGTFGILGVNAEADETNRLAVRSAASLFDGEADGHSLKLNKSASSSSANVMWQIGYSGRAELGLLGSDDWQLKVSADGIVWEHAFTVDRTNGHIGLGKSPGAARLEVSGGIRNSSSFSPYIQLVNTGAGGTQAWIGVPDWNRSAFYIYGAQADVMSVYDAPTRSHRLFAGGNERVRIASGGEVGVGTAAPTARLHVAGPVRTGSYLKAALPSAASVGAGTLAYVQDAAGGAQFAYSDGAQWLKMRDGAAV